jgi:chaperonin GroES
MIKATGHHVLVRVEKPEHKTAGGIIMPDQVRDAEKRGAEIGIVLGFGPTAWMAEGLGGRRWCEVGDRIFFAKYSGKWVKDPTNPEAEELLVIRDDDVVAVVRDDQ